MVTNTTLLTMVQSVRLHLASKLTFSPFADSEDASDHESCDRRTVLCPCEQGHTRFRNQASRWEEAWPTPREALGRRPCHPIPSLRLRETGRSQLCIALSCYSRGNLLHSHRELTHAIYSFNTSKG